MLNYLYIRRDNSMLGKEMEQKEMDNRKKLAIVYKWLKVTTVSTVFGRIGSPKKSRFAFMIKAIILQ